MVTLKEIAKRTGVAESTVSRILNRDSSLAISEKKRRRVIETAEALQYVPRRERNARNRDVAAALRPPTELESVVILHHLSSAQELEHPFFVGLRKGIEARCEFYGLATTRIVVDSFDPASLNGARNLGVIVIGDPQENLCSELRGLGIPLSIVGPKSQFQHNDVVHVDLRKAATSLCNWLMDQGNTRIAMLGPENESSFRFQGYRTALEARGLYDPDYVVLLGADLYPAEQQTRQLFAQLAEKGLPPPDVILALVDRMATGIYTELNKLGLSIPKDVQVAAFNDSAISRMIVPSLTTMRLEAGVLGETAVDLIIERKSGREAVKHVEVMASIISRDSTR